MALYWLARYSLCCHLLLTARAYLIKWNSDASSSIKGTLKIKHTLVKVDSRDENNTEFENHQEKFANMSLDERCSSGLDLSAAFQMYTPYVDTVHDPKYLILSGIIPALMADILTSCCPLSKVTFAEVYKSIKQAEESFDRKKHLDFTFPIYGLQGYATTTYKDHPFIPLVEAPRMVLLVPESLFENKNTRTQVLLKTVLNSWPMLVFISVSACLSGLIIWFLDRNKNPGEFPPSFFVGAWEGFWWAFVTMTTVGYGDRSPKSILARMFCIFWILCGIILISLFTGLVTAALHLSATPVFNLPGAKIGAISGSKEYQIGVGLNADMSAYPQHHQIFEKLSTNELDGAIIDNYILSAIRDRLENEKLRIEREIPYSVTYGVAIRENSPNTEKCFRRYVHHYPQKMFETISEKLKPVKNPTDDVRVEVLAAEKLFYEENVFKLVVYIQTGLLGIFVFGGIIWEFFVRNNPTVWIPIHLDPILCTWGLTQTSTFRRHQNSTEKGKYGMFHATARKRKEEVEENCPLQIRKEQENVNISDLDLLIDEYDSFQESWMSKLHLLKAEMRQGKNGTVNMEVVEKGV